MTFSVLLTLLVTFYTVYGLLIVKQGEWVRNAFEEAVFVNLELTAQYGAPNKKDAFAQTVLDLKISKSFLDKLMVEED